MQTTATIPLAFGGVGIALIVLIIILLTLATFLLAPFVSALWERRNERKGDRGMGVDSEKDEDSGKAAAGDRVPNREQRDREKGEIPH